MRREGAARRSAGAKVAAISSRSGEGEIEVWGEGPKDRVDGA